MSEEREENGEGIKTMSEERECKSDENQEQHVSKEKDTKVCIQILVIFFYSFLFFFP